MSKEFKRENNRFSSLYTPEQKLDALSLLFASEREVDGVLVPYYTEIANQTNIPISTLRTWWRNKETLLLQFRDLITQRSLRSSAMLSDTIDLTIEKVTKRLAKGNLTKERLSDFGNLLKALTTSQRMMAGLSTVNVAKNVSVTGRVELVEPRDLKS